MKILALANECFCQTSSNGRTMMNLLAGISPHALAQFYLHGTPDESVCRNYYSVTDRQALAAFFHRSWHPTESAHAAESGADSSNKKITRSCRNLVLREMVWRSKKWWKPEFDEFIEHFNPTVILLQAGDSPFLMNIASAISTKYKIPLVIYNSEGYILKKTLYSGVKHYSPWHLLLQKMLRTEYKKMMKSASYCIYSTEELEEAYQMWFPHPGRSMALYTVSDMPYLKDLTSENVFHILYCGNLGVGRAKTLEEIADYLQDELPGVVLDIYGRFVCEEDEANICAKRNVHYGGVVPYEDVASLMEHTNLLLHCENPDRLENLKYAFSTKIADSLACGRPFLVYASREYPFVKYLEKNDAAFIASTKEELIETVKRCQIDKTYLYSHIVNAQALAIKNHSKENNQCKMEHILCELEMS